MQAREIYRVQPEGNYVFIKGSAQDPNSDFVHAGQLEVLAPAIESGAIEVVGEQYVDGWLPELAQRVMEQILTANGDRVDAVVCEQLAVVRRRVGEVVLAGRNQGVESATIRDALGREAAALLVAGEDGAELVLGAPQGLMQRHAGPARIGENFVYAVPHQRFD